MRHHRDRQLVIALSVPTRELLRIAGAAVPPGAGDGFWARKLPDRALEVLLEDPAGQAGDFLITGEVQDIASQAIFETADDRELLRRSIPAWPLTAWPATAGTCSLTLTTRRAVRRPEDCSYRTLVTSCRD